MPKPPSHPPTTARWGEDGPGPETEIRHVLVYITSLLEKLREDQSRAFQQQVQQTCLLTQLQGCQPDTRKQEVPCKDSETTVANDSENSALAPALVSLQDLPGDLGPTPFNKTQEQEQKLNQKAMAPRNNTAPVALQLPTANEFLGCQLHESVLRRKVDRDDGSAEAQNINEHMDKLDRAGTGDLDDLQKTNGWYSFLRKEVRGYRWEIAFGLLVILNTVVMSLESQYVGMQVGHELGYPFSVEVPNWGHDVFDVLHDVFLVIFLAEIIVKLAVLRCSFWFVAWDVVDFLVVVVGVTIRGLELAENDMSEQINPMMLRLARLIRLVRFLKMFKLAGSMHSMNLILKSVIATQGTLFWSMTLLFMVQWVAGMFVSQLTKAFLGDSSNNHEARWAVYRYYGTFTKTQFTMFEITHVNYSQAARVLVDNVSEWWCWFFIAYRCLVAFAFLQVIRSVFIQMTLKVADRDKDLVIHNKKIAMQELHKKLGDIFNLLESDGDGAMSFDEFVHQLKQDSTKIWLSALDIDVSDPEGLFELLDLKGNGEVSKMEFTFGAAQLRGAAQSRDLFHMQTLVERMEAKLDTLLPCVLRGKVFPVEADKAEVIQETEAETDTWLTD